MKLSLFSTAILFSILFGMLKTYTSTKCVEVTTYVSVTGQDGEEVSFKDLLESEKETVVGHFSPEKGWFEEMFAYPFESEHGVTLDYGKCWTFVKGDDLLFKCRFKLPSEEDVSLEKSLAQVKYGVEIGADTWGEGTLPDIEGSPLTVFPLFDNVRMC